MTNHEIVVSKPLKILSLLKTHVLCKIKVSLHHLVDFLTFIVDATSIRVTRPAANTIPGTRVEQ